MPVQDDMKKLIEARKKSTTGGNTVGMDQGDMPSAKFPGRESPVGRPGFEAAKKPGGTRRPKTDTVVLPNHTNEKPGMLAKAKKLLKQLGMMKENGGLLEAKKYIVFVDGEQQKELISAGSLNAAEKKAAKKWPGKQVTCEYTEESINEAKINKEPLPGDRLVMSCETKKQADTMLRRFRADAKDQGMYYLVQPSPGKFDIYEIAFSPIARKEDLAEGKPLYWPVNQNGKKLTKKPMGIERANAYLDKYSERVGEDGGLRAAVNLKIDPKAMVKGQAVMSKGGQYEGWRWVGKGKNGTFEIEKEGKTQELLRNSLKDWQRTSHPSYDKEYEFNIEDVQRSKLDPITGKYTLTPMKDEATKLIESVEALIGKPEGSAATPTTEATCNGKLANGPGKKYTVCGKCGRKDYEANEGDRCGQELPNDKLAKQPTAKARKEGRDFIEELIDESPDPDLFRQKLDEALARRYALRTEAESELTSAGTPDIVAFNTELAKILKRLKKDLGAEYVNQNYKGTGSQKHRRQIFVRFPWGSIDLWLNTNRCDLGGVISPLGRPTPTVPYENRRPEQVYADIVRHLKMWKDRHAEGTKAEAVVTAEYLKPFYGWTPKQKKAFQRAVDTEGEIVKLKLGDGSTENYFYKNGEVEVRLLSISASRSEAIYYDTEGKFLRRGH